MTIQNMIRIFLIILYIYDLPCKTKQTQHTHMKQTILLHLFPDTKMLWERNSDLQAGIWFGTVAPSPMITISPFPYGLVVFAWELVFSEHVWMPNAAYIYFITSDSISGLHSS